jgi:hypothetical protein
MESKADRYFRTLREPCEVCGNTWHNHLRTCQHYHSCDLERCDIQHSLFLRSSDPKRELRYEYECNLCTLPPIFFAVEIKYIPHPLCETGVHFWETHCACDTCCRDKAFCSTCGRMRLLSDIPMRTWRIQRLMSGDRMMTRRAAETVVDAAMYGIGCTEGRVREEQQKQIDGEKK